MSVCSSLFISVCCPGTQCVGRETTHTVCSSNDSQINRSWKMGHWDQPIMAFSIHLFSTSTAADFQLVWLRLSIWVLKK